MSNTIHASTSFFSVKKIMARSTNTSGAPLILDLSNGDARAEIIIFTEDQGLTDRLIKAINGCFAEELGA